MVSNGPWKTTIKYTHIFSFISSGTFNPILMPLFDAQVGC